MHMKILYRTFAIFIISVGLLILWGCAGLFIPSGGGNNDFDSSMQLPQEVISSSNIYYIDSETGSDTNTGSQESPWKTLLHANDGTLDSEDTLLLKRGGTYRGQLIVESGTAQGWTGYGAYGAGDRPLILGSKNVSLDTDWADEGNNIWKSIASFPCDVGSLFVNGLTGLNNKKWFLGELSSQGDFYYDRVSEHLYLYSSGNPGNVYNNIEAALTRHIVDISNSSYALFEDLHLQFGSAHGFGGGNSSHLIVRSCEISYIGGGHLDGEGSESRRYGNGLEFWANASDHLVENCRIYEIYDTGLTNQSNGGVSVQKNIVYRNNVIWNCGLSSFEIWNRPAQSRTENIYFINNSCYNARAGWGGNRNNRSDPYIFHVAIFYHEAQTREVHIENNIFFSDIQYTDGEGIEAQMLFYEEDPWGYQGFISVDYNLWAQPADPYMLTNNSNTYYAYNHSDLNQYTEDTGYDDHSLFQDPLFSDPQNGDFTLQNTSPAVDAGTYQQYRSTDINGSAVTGLPDLGATEY
jgi:hypothetical protein